MENIVEISYAQTGESTHTNKLGMREMQAKVYEARNQQHLLLIGGAFAPLFSSCIIRFYKRFILK